MIYKLTSTAGKKRRRNGPLQAPKKTLVKRGQGMEFLTSARLQDLNSESF